mmetsp:Transcript_27900/g.64833  ORF Transcript_27900/g.64833 Transcript_27900/m.64833 type:complete len:126 (+) Transcript_27900:79-456(+)|eukprot:CAMPEP_0178446434 /NCGR_PEP_ID=MMETSP0689_2-20121128/40802_1 /TAXON_ID=160604 /ORGANISM="Amphidinium massartii, Strain CS-259" /LENGTH=125 /DNA_ID=CAMNT_0020071259 /DNA_START=79 /DNA_END=456 /DNA_ORIENTATION=-
MVSSNVFACGANQNCGNVITDRPTTRIHHAPGGTSSICIGDGSATAGASHPPRGSRQRPAAEPAAAASQIVESGPSKVHPAARGGTVSANQFANGSNQNCGNVLTDRPTTRIRQAPGGNSSLVLG